MVVGFVDREIRVMMSSRENGPTRKGIDPRIRVASGDVDALSKSPLLVPLDGHPMGSVFGANATWQRDEARANGFEANQTDAADGEPICELGAKRWRQVARHHIRIDPKVGQDTPVDDAADYRDSHRLILCGFGYSDYQRLWSRKVESRGPLIGRDHAVNPVNHCSDPPWCAANDGTMNLSQMCLRRYL